MAFDWLSMIGAAGGAVEDATSTQAAADPFGYWFSQWEGGQKELENYQMKQRQLASMNIDDMLKKTQLAGMQGDLNWRHKFRQAFTKM